MYMMWTTCKKPCAVYIFYIQGVGFLLVLVFDVDSETLDDTVDAIIVPILPSSLGQYSPSRPYDGVFEFGTLTARYRVDCDDTFFGEG